MTLTPAELSKISGTTLAHYDQRAESFWQGTRDHDVSQNIAALLNAINAEPPLVLLDFGCGPGRDLKTFAEFGHVAIGLDGSSRFVSMARDHSHCEVWHQDFLKLNLPAEYFDGVYANASLFHIPRQELPRVLRELYETLKRGGVLFSSNPRGQNEEGWHGGRYGAHLDIDTWRAYMIDAGLSEVMHYYRPEGLPREQQPWLASVWRRAL